MVDLVVQPFSEPYHPPVYSSMPFMHSRPPESPKFFSLKIQSPSFTFDQTLGSNLNEMSLFSVLRSEVKNSELRSLPSQLQVQSRNAYSFDRLLGEIGSLSDSLSQLSTQQLQAGEEEQLKERLTSLQTNLDSLHKRLAPCEPNMAEPKQMRDCSVQAIIQVEQTDLVARLEQAELVARLEQKQQEIQKLQAQLQTNNGKYLRVCRKLQALISCQSLRVDELSQLRKKKDRLNGEYNELLSQHEQSVINMAEMDSIYKGAILDYHNTISEQQASLADCENTISAQQASLADYQNSISALQSNIADYQNTILEQQASLVDCRNTISEQESELSQLHHEQGQTLSMLWASRSRDQEEHLHLFNNLSVIALRANHPEFNLSDESSRIHFESMLQQLTSAYHQREQSFSMRSRSRRMSNNYSMLHSVLHGSSQAHSILEETLIQPILRRNIHNESTLSMGQQDISQSSERYEEGVANYSYVMAAVQREQQ